ncbi:hypothetical protein [Methylomonas sp. DH-1]|uniref:hypothetical protein n=1 Tax=Methylomonas sp. (strain DH-1) TaxID=1727196 RepID=UPI000A5FB438|nr:hypothetical protein [Methylomonas sp. DH-1]
MTDFNTKKSRQPWVRGNISGFFTSLLNTLLDKSKTPDFSGDTLLNEDGGYYEFDDKSLILHGIYDLPMIDGERIDINRRYQKLENGVDLTLSPCDGVFVMDDEGFLFKLVEAESLDKKYSMPNSSVYKLATELPKDSVLLVRTQSLVEFEDLLDEGTTKNKTDISEIERNNLLKQVAGIALALAEKNNRYKKGESVSANAVAESVIEIIESLPNAKKYGLGKTNIRESIGKGIRLITESE